LGGGRKGRRLGATHNGDDEIAVAFVFHRLLTLTCRENALAGGLLLRRNIRGERGARGGIGRHIVRIGFGAGLGDIIRTVGGAG